MGVKRWVGSPRAVAEPASIVRDNEAPTYGSNSATSKGHSPVHHEELAYPALDRDLLSHFYVKDDAGRRPGVLVFPAASGVTDLYRGFAQALAQMGYAALACDIHGGGRTLPKDMTVARPILDSLNAHPELVRARARASLDALAGRQEVDPKRIAAVGYCLGGGFALELARSGAALVAAIGVHSPLAASNPADARKIKGKVLILNGADDPTVTLEQRLGFEAEMRGAGVDWQIHLFGGVVHSFTTPDASSFGRPTVTRYDPRAASRAWRIMCDLLQEAFGEET